MNTDNRPPPPSNAPRFGARLYRSNLRPIVIALAALSSLWALFSAIGFFRAIGEEKSQNIRDLVPISIALGALYLAVCAIELFGAVSAASRKVRLVRIYALLSAFTTLVVLASGVLRIVIHFTKKDRLIEECSTITERSGVAVYPFGFWGPVRNDDLDKGEADEWCKRSWEHGSWSEILSTLITSFIAGFWTLIVYSYYRQLLDPSSVANQTRAPVGPGGYPSHYNPPYNASVPHLGYGYNMPYAGGPPPGQYGVPGQYAPPQGPPPQFAPPPGAPPGYVGSQGGYTAEKDDNPFEDFTETNKAQNKPSGQS